MADMFIFFAVMANKLRQQEAERERQHLLETIEENRRLEEEQANRMREKHQNYQRDLIGQIQYNQLLRQEQFEREEDEYIKGMQAEREYQSKLQSCLDNPEYEKVHPMRRAMQQRALNP